MSQIVGFLSSGFAFIASDSNIADEKGESLGFRNKLFQGEGFIIATAGISFGIDLIEGFLVQSKMLGIKWAEEIENYFVNHGNLMYRQFLKVHGKDVKDELKRLYILFAGLTEEGKLTLRLIGSEGEDSLKAVPFSDVVTAPRRLGLELALMKLKNVTMFELSNFIFENLKKISEKDHHVKPPFHILFIDRNGLVIKNKK